MTCSQTLPLPGLEGLVTTDAFRIIAELSGDLAFILDVDSGLPAYLSPGADAMLGYGLAEFQAQLQHQAFADATDRADAGPLAPLCAGLPERLRRFSAGDASRLRVQREFDLRRPDGSDVALEIVSTLALDATGKPQALLGLVRDISAQRAQVREQKRFASMLNHEFRTPLSTIDGAIQRLEATQTHVDEPTRQRYRRIAGATDRLIAMLDDYLSPEQMTALGTQRRDNTVTPRLLLDEWVAQARAAGRPVTFETDDLPPALRGEPAGLRLALKVLLDNALRYTPAGSALAVAGRRGVHGIELVLRDSGPGVPPDEVAYIFDKGYRGANATGIAGSGLGLYMARSVVDVHGGSLQYAAPAVGGAEFRLWLPLREEAVKGLA